MRITQNMMTQQFIYNITNQNQQMQTLENELSTGKSLNQPSDNPLTVSQDMGIRASLSETTSYQSSINSGLSWMQNTSSAIQQISTALQSLQSTVLEGINSTNRSSSSLQALSETAQQLSASIYQELNAKQGDRYLFGGVQTNVAPTTTTLPPYSTVSTSDGQFYSVLSSFTTTNSSSITSDGSPITQSITDAQNILSGSQPYSLQLSETTSSTGTVSSGNIKLMNSLTGAILATGSIASGASSGTIVTLTSVSGAAQMTLTLSNPVSSTSSGSFSISDSLVPTTSFSTGFSVVSGTSGSISYNVAPNVDIPINVSAHDLMLSGVSGTSLQNTLQQISTDLLTGNTNGLENDLTNLQVNMTNVTNINSDVGSRIQRLTSLQNQMSSYQTTLTNQKGVIQGANMAQVISQFNTDQTVYTAALKMGSQILLPSLISFLPS